MNMPDNLLKEAVLSADEDTLTALSNKGIYKRACKDAEVAASAVDVDIGENSAEVRFADAVSTVVFPLSESRCSCPSRTVCRHIISAVLLLKKEFGTVKNNEIPVNKTAPDEKESLAEVPSETVSAGSDENILSVKDTAAVNEAAAVCMKLTESLIIGGIVRSAETVPEDFEIAAVRCHAVRAADAERLVRSAGSRLSDYIGRRASFDLRSFTRLLCDCAYEFRKLSGSLLTENDLGDFRRTYADHFGILDIMPVGGRKITGGDYEGDIVYFLDMDERSGGRFLSFSDIRPVFYEKRSSRPPAPASAWSTGISAEKMKHSRIKLAGAKICCGKLSSSKETSVLMQEKAVLDCAAVHRMIVTDFREIALKLSSSVTLPNGELDRLFFIRPKRLVKYYFDKHTQLLRIALEDEYENIVTAVLRFRAETKQLIEQTESICAKMKKTERVYTLLVSAEITNGYLEFFPIEFYDFIMPLELHRFYVPAGYELFPEKASYAKKITELFDEAEDRMDRMVRSGLRAYDGDHGDLLRHISDCGMEHFYCLAEDFFGSAAAYRHSTSRGAEDIPEKMSALQRYIDEGRRRTALILSVYNMRRDE